MKNLRHATALAIASLGIFLAGVPAFAHDGDEACEPEMMNQNTPPSDRSSVMEQRLIKIKAELGITAAQEEAWKTFANKIRQQQESMKDFREAMQRNPPPLAARNQVRMGMQGRMAAHAKELAASLTPEQKAVLDKHFGQGQS